MEDVAVFAPAAVGTAALVDLSLVKAGAAFSSALRVVRRVCIVMTPIEEVLSGSCSAVRNSVRDVREHQKCVTDSSGMGNNAP